MGARLFRSARGSINRIIDEPWREHVWNASRCVRVVKSILGPTGRVWTEPDGSISIGIDSPTGRVYAGRGADYDSALKAALFPRQVAEAVAAEEAAKGVGDVTKPLGDKDPLEVAGEP